MVGGAISISAGAGSSDNEISGGGCGGAICVLGGGAEGGAFVDDGGTVSCVGGFARTGCGGSLLTRSGYGEGGSSGVIDLATANAGEAGVSGAIDLSTGATGLDEEAAGGATGSCRVVTSTATRGRAGYVHLAVGSGTSGTAGDVVIISSTSASAASGGGAADKTGGGRASGIWAIGDDNIRNVFLGYHKCRYVGSFRIDPLCYRHNF